MSALLVLLNGSLTSGDQVKLVERGEARAVIVLPADPEPCEELAAEELVTHLELMTGAALARVAVGEAPDGLLPIHLGRSADDALAPADERDAAADPSAFVLRVRDDRIDIRGYADQGTLFGVYELLEQLGFRWYMPGDLGRVVPEHETARVDHQDRTHAPSMDYRHLQHIRWGMWRHRARLGGRFREHGGHSIPGVHARRDRDPIPDWYSEIDGVRQRGQVCLSNPEALELATEAFRERAREMGGDVQYIGASSHDGGGYCECDGCKALDQGVYDPTGDRESMTDRYIWFFNQVLDNLEDEFPNLHIATYTYGAHMMPPAIEMNPRIVPSFAPITLDRTRGMDNPMSPDRHLLRWLIDEYAERGVNEMNYRGYYHNLACPSFPYSQINRIRHETPAFHEAGIRFMHVENIRSSWSMNTLDLYLATRMMWDVNIDVDALLEEFYEKFYGPAREPMQQYHEQLEAAFRDTPYFTGSSYLYFPIFLDHPRRDALRALLDEAASRIGDEDSLYAERVRVVRMGWDRMDLFLDMIEARNDHDFATAHAKMEAFDRLSDEMVAYVLDDGEVAEFRDDHPHFSTDHWLLQRATHRLLHWSERADDDRNYFTWFFRSPIEAGHERAVEQGEIVATLPDQWLFLLDPAEIGEVSGYHRPGVLGGNWGPIKTSSRSWSDQGLHYYKGVAWYRTSIEIPADYEGRPIYLWFGGVDHVAHVWLNGEFMGTSREPAEGLPGVPGSFAPFDMPTVDEHGESVLNFGGENWIVVKIENRSLAELGTGGILAPVMFWSPHDPQWAPEW